MAVGTELFPMCPSILWSPHLPICTLGPRHTLCLDYWLRSRRALRWYLHTHPCKHTHVCMCTQTYMLYHCAMHTGYVQKECL